MADAIIELVEESEDDAVEELEGVELLVSYFNIVNGVAIPKPNIADMFSEETLMKVGANVCDGYQADLDSMEEWSSFVKLGLELVKQEKTAKSTPWEGASNFKSPTLMQAALKFSDRASTELLRQEDIVKTSIIGQDSDGQKQKTANRVAEYSNYQLNVEMEEWRDEHEKLLYQLPYDGCAFKKTFFDSRLGRPVSNVILAPNFVVNNDADSITRLRRFSETIELSKNEVLDRQRQGIWLDDEISFSDSGSENDTQDQAKADKFTTFIEQQGYFDLDGDGYEEPYTFVVCQNSKQVVRIVPRFEPYDVLVRDEGTGRAAPLDGVMRLEGNYKGRKIVRIKPVNTITKYGLLRDPEGGFLDIGYSYLLGAITSAINATTNQLVDAGTLSNRQGGWLAKGFRRKMGDSAFKPGQWKQTGISAMDLHNGIVPLPVKEPSSTLFALMQLMIQTSQELSASADLTKALGANAPATTTLALVQEQQQSAGAIILRIYRAMSSEFKKLFVLNSKFLDPAEYQEILDDPEANFESDFDLRKMNIVPIANPEISSKIQRIQQAEAELSKVELVAAAGGNIRPLIKGFFESIGSQNVEEIFPEEDAQMQLQRILSENPDLAQMIMGEAERMDLLAAAQADALEREQEREDLKYATEADERYAKIKKYEAETIKTLEEAETEDLNNSISTYTTELQLDAQDLQNKQALKQLNQPMEPRNGNNPAGSTRVE